MTDQFPIIVVPESAAAAIEAMGSKPKFWFDDPNLGRCLFKESRPGTGEDWAEKLAAELAELLGIPHADVELAVCGGRRGTVSRSFVPPGGQLVHGNEVLVHFEPGYPKSLPGSRRFSRTREHTVELVMAANQGIALPVGWAPIAGVTSAAAVMIGYLMLDAWIGNTDRHHENWGWLLYRPGPAAVSLHLAPTFDHASSLGRELSDSQRQERVVTRDKNRTVAAYVEKARSALYTRGDAARPLVPYEAFRVAAGFDPDASRAWLARLDAVRMDRVQEMFGCIPSDLISEAAATFVSCLLDRTRHVLLP